MSETTRKLVFKFDGANVNTGAFGKDFLSLIASVYSLAEACSDDEVQIESIENNCIKITLAVATLACSVICGDHISLESSSIRNPKQYNAAVRSINATLKKRKATLELSDSSNQVLCKFDEVKELPSAPEVQTETETFLAVYGELLDIGGVNPNAHIKSESFDDDVVLSVDRSIALDLAPRLYSQIGVNARVVIRNRKVISGSVLNVIDYDPVDIDTWLKNTRESLGIEAFKGVDIAKFIAEQRV